MRFLICPLIVVLAAAGCGAGAPHQEAVQSAPPNPPLFRTKPLSHSVESFKCPKRPVATPEIEACLSQQLLRIHRKLNARVLVLWRRLRGSNVDRGYFVQAQQAWRRYVELECQVEYRSELGGTGAPVVFAACELTLTKQYLRAVDDAVADYNH